MTLRRQTKHTWISWKCCPLLERRKGLNAALAGLRVEWNIYKDRDIRGKIHVIKKDTSTQTITGVDYVHRTPLALQNEANVETEFIEGRIGGYKDETRQNEVQHVNVLKAKDNRQHKYTGGQEQLPSGRSGLSDVPFNSFKANSPKQSGLLFAFCEESEPFCPARDLDA